jgi:hypothetical protein
MRDKYIHMDVGRCMVGAEGCLVACGRCITRAGWN